MLERKNNDWAKASTEEKGFGDGEYDGEHVHVWRL